MKNALANKRGFTLVEVIIAMSIFVISLMMASRVLADVVRLQKKSSIMNGVYEDARIILQQLSGEIQNGAVDYEEYYNIKVLQDSWLVKYYGINYGVYGSRFYDPGQILSGGAGVSPDDLGVECSEPNPLPEGEECEIYYSHSSDLNTGSNPYGGENDADADAFCDEGEGVSCVASEGAPRNLIDELYLIDSTGTRKTIIASRVVSGGADESKGIGLMRMNGRDWDQNGVIDIFSCDEEFNCAGEYETDTLGKKLSSAIKYRFLGDMDNPAGYLIENNISVPTSDDLSIPYNPAKSQFVPITPKNSVIKSLKFFINPLEDPHKAYAEKNIQTHSSITIFLTLGLSEEAEAEFPGNFPDLTLQTTVASGVIGKIDSYPPVNDVLRDGNDASWINEVFE